MTQNQSILIADDDLNLSQCMKKYLMENNYNASSVHNGLLTVQKLKKQELQYKLVILDINMPVMDGLEACRKIREFSNIPIIMLTAAKEDIDKVLGLEIGADDYMVKPFNLRELLARIKAILRRSQMINPTNNKGILSRMPVYEFSGWCLDTSNRSLTSADGIEISITSGMYEILVALIEQPRQILTRYQLMDIIHGRELDAFDRTIDVQISRLRKKIEIDSKQPKLIKTIRSIGYMFTAKVNRL